ncbi:MAG: hypothetical protein PHO23_03300 [Candidatus Pacebacteria bacterium]|nr:hypothetical protein [Candidatus Paceibacterota bacterium]
MSNNEERVLNEIIKKILNCENVDKKYLNEYISVSAISQDLKISQEKIRENLKNLEYSQDFKNAKWQKNQSINYLLWHIYNAIPQIEPLILNIFLPETKTEVRKRIKESFITNDWVESWIAHMFYKNTSLFSEKEKKEIFSDLVEFLEASLVEDSLGGSVMNFTTLERFIRVYIFAEIFIYPSEDPVIIPQIKKWLKQIEKLLIREIKRGNNNSMVDIFKKKIGKFKFLDYLSWPEFFTRGVGGSYPEDPYSFPYELNRIRSMLGERTWL